MNFGENKRTSLLSGFKSEIKKGGFPIGTERNGLKKVADTGGKGDWVPLSEVQKKNTEQAQSTKSDPEVSDAEIAAFEAEIPKPTVEETWQAYDVFLNMVANGTTKSLVAFGTGGVGKTFTLGQVLKKYGLVEFDEDKHSLNASDEYDYVKVTGAASGSSVYQALFEYQDKLIIFDDCDSVLKDQNAVNFFKGALDSSGDGTISYKASNPMKTDRIQGAKETATGITIVPSRFKFKGSVIFISNLPPTEIPQPLIDSRCLSVDLSMSKGQTIDRLKMILPKMDILDAKGKSLGIPENEKKMALDFLNQHKEKIREGKLNARTLGNIAKVIHATKGDRKLWESSAMTLLYN